MAKIKVHEKALAHLSRGLYRSPASALRELVSNAWDAGATVVRINTNYPLFYQLSVEDNGAGFTREDFENLMEGGVGNSEKRTAAEPEPLPFDRPLIGRLGIGLLGIAQICGAFTIVSKPSHGNGFRASVRLYDLLKERLDRKDSELVKEVEVKEAQSETAPKPDESGQQTITEVDIGEYSFEDYDEAAYKRGTRITADDVHPTFVDTFQKSLKFEKFKPPPLDWSKALKIASSVHSLQELGDYWKLLWELSASCPLTLASKHCRASSLRMSKSSLKATGLECLWMGDSCSNQSGFAATLGDIR
ncbi:MAG: ATP-binding protein [Acidobacteriota bacterium]